MKNHFNEGESAFGSPAYLASKLNGFRFVPLVHNEGFLYSHIHILMLRRMEPHSMVQPGDLDGRLKTLSDALKMPGPNKNELGGHIPEDGEDPFYCLLEDDNLISKATIENDVLLEPEKDGDPQNYARVIITVEVKASIFRGGGYGSA